MSTEFGKSLADEANDAKDINSIVDSGKSAKLTKEQYQLLLFFEQHYWRTSGLPTFKAISSTGVDLEEEAYYTALTNPRFLSGLRGRGVPEHLINELKNDGRKTLESITLTEKQMLVANVLLDTYDKRSRLKKLTELGVSTAEYNLWIKNPVYREYCLSRAEALLEEAQPQAHMSLIERVAQGDLGAIKYFNAITGRYRERVSAGVEVNVTNVTGSDMLIRVVEVIQRHVKDPELLSAIGEDILALTQTGNPVGTFRPVGAIEGKVVDYAV